MPEYDPFTALREEVDRFYKTNTFNPMEVTNLYVQAKVLLSEYARLLTELTKLRDENKSLRNASRIKSAADLMEESGIPMPE